MRTIQLVIFCFISLTHSFGQESKYSFSISEESKTFSRPFRGEGDKKISIPLVIKKNKSKENTESEPNHFYIKVGVEDITTEPGDVEIVGDSVFIVSDDLFGTNDSIVKIITLKLKSTLSDIDQVFQINVLTGSELSNCQKTFDHKVTLYNADNWTAVLSKDLFTIGGLYKTSDDLIIYKRLQRKDGRKQPSFRNLKEGTEKSYWRKRRFNKLYTNHSKSKFKIEYIEIHVTQGRISHIQVKVENDPGGFYENKGPISLTNFRKRKYYALEYQGSNADLVGTFIFIKDFLNYVPGQNRYYFPTDNKYIMTPHKDSVSILSDGSPVNYFEAKTFSDFQGLSGEKNGLVQTELNARFVSNSNSIGRSYMTLAQFVYVDLGYSKFDSQFEVLDLPQSDSVNSHLHALTRQSNAFFNVEIDVLRATHVHDAYLKVGHRIYQTKVSFSDTLSPNRIFSPSWYMSLGGTIYPTKRITADFCFPVSLFYSFDQPFLNYYKGWELMFSPQIQLSYKINKDLSSESHYTQIFFRVRYFDMPNLRGNNYWQTQFGLEIPLSNIMKS